MLSRTAFWRFASFLPGGFTTIAVINPLEKKLVKHTSVHCAAYSAWQFQSAVHCIIKGANSRTTFWNTSIQGNEFSDVKIICDGQIFDCHKTILSCQSEVFQGTHTKAYSLYPVNLYIMLYTLFILFDLISVMLNDNPMIEGASGEVHITDFTEDVIENLLPFMYNDIVDKKNINCDLLKAANKYLMEGLKNICSEYLSGTVFQREILEFSSLCNDCQSWRAGIKNSQIFQCLCSCSVVYGGSFSLPHIIKGSKF